MRLGRVFGFPIELNLSWFLIFALVALSLGAQYFPAAFAASATTYAITAIITAALFFASVLFHEISHSLVARAGGIAVTKVTLFVFGGVAEMEKEPDSPGKEFLMAAAGPAASFLLAGIFYGLGALSQLAGAGQAVYSSLVYLTGINVLVGVFNLLPGFPLDGGRVLRAALWRLSGDLLRATRWASRSGQVIGAAMIALGLAGVVTGNFASIWSVLIGWFLMTLAGATYRQEVMKSRLHRVTVDRIMSQPVVVASGTVTLDRAIDEYFLGGKHSRYPVEVDGRLVGIVNLQRVKAVPRDLWQTKTLADIAAGPAENFLAPADTPVDALLGRLLADDPGALLVERGGVLAGIVTRADALRALSVAGERS
jgi:Zn-dependent protease/CBS domain-containing protein